MKHSRYKYGLLLTVIGIVALCSNQQRGEEDEWVIVIGMSFYFKQFLELKLEYLNLWGFIQQFTIFLAVCAMETMSMSLLAFLIPKTEEEYTKIVVTYLRWWKSWASGDGINGKWYPLCVLIVVISARENHIQDVAIWEPMIRGPKIIGPRLDIRCSKGWAYIATMPMGAVHSWWILWTKR